MKKREQVMYAVFGILGLFLLFKKSGGTTPPPPPPPLTCPLYYTSDGAKCIPITPQQVQSWSFIADPGNVDSNGFRIVTSPRIPNGFTGCIVIHVQVTNASTHEQVAYEIYQTDFQNYGGGYINRTFTIALPTPLTLYNVFAYVTNCAITERYTGLVYKQVRTT